MTLSDLGALVALSFAAGLVALLFVLAVLVWLAGAPRARPAPPPPAPAKSPGPEI